MVVKAREFPGDRLTARRTIFFVTTEPAGVAALPVIYSIQEGGKRLTRVTAGAPPLADDAGGGGGGGFGGGISDLSISRDGRTVFFAERNGIYSVALGSTAAATTAARVESPRRRISFNVRVKID